MKSKTHNKEKNGHTTLARQTHSNNKLKNIKATILFKQIIKATVA